MAMLVNDESWPPKSARQALLSSPDGRKRYTDLQSRASASPMKRAPGTPSLLDRLRLARRDEDHFDQEEDDEDDEETLQLKLAAIEAKLKLKKLQNKARRGEEAGLRTASEDKVEPRVEVALSPIKRSIPKTEHRSPSRVLLGIDKGVTGADVSLRRAKTATTSPLKDRMKHRSNDSSRPDSRPSASRLSQKEQSAQPVQVKSFSERMAAVRDNDKKEGDRREDAQRARSKKFNLDAAEMERFKIVAEEPQRRNRLTSPAKDTSNHTSLVQPPQQLGLRKVKTLPDIRSSAENEQGDATMFEGFSGVHLSSRILPHSFLKRTLQSDDFTIWKIPDLLKNVTSPAYELPDDVGSFVLFGIIASKSSPLDQKNRADERTKASSDWEKKWEDGSMNRKKFIALTLTDLKWTVDLFLFDTAVPRYHRLTPGTVVAILNPSIMPPKRGREDTGAFSLAIHDGDDTILEIGKSKHLGYCDVVKRDGKECGQWVNVVKSNICEWHLNAQIAKTKAKRMGINSGTNGFGGDDSRNRTNSGGAKGNGYGGGYGLAPTKRTQGFDRESGSHYFVSSSNPGSRATPKFNSEVSTARMLDMDDDPFIAEGQFERSKEARLQKRMANEAKERQIASRLADLGSGSSAGSNYMRQRAENNGSLESSKSDVRQRRNQVMGPSSHYNDTASTIDMAQSSKPEIGRKRPAEDISLSPVKKKKTRFVTDRGIKEAGRESLGVSTNDLRPRQNFDDDDDDLDIV